MVDHINIVERKLIDNLRDGTYNTTAGIGSGSAWATTDVNVFGQFPFPDDQKYPSIVVDLVANGIEEQFMGQKLTSGGTLAVGELYGVGFNIWCAVDQLSSITVGSTAYKQRRLLNYMMLNCANVLMDCDFSTANADGDTAEVVSRNFAGFRDIGYNPELEIWFSRATLIVTFKNTR